MLHVFNSSHATAEAPSEQMQALVQDAVKSTLGAVLGTASGDAVRGIAAANNSMGGNDIMVHPGDSAAQPPRSTAVAGRKLTVGDSGDPNDPQSRLFVRTPTPPEARYASYRTL